MTGFKLRTPCEHCPFRVDIPGYLRRERAIEISASLADGAVFPCHTTTVEDPHDPGENTLAEHSQFCAGALIVMERIEQPNQIVRIAERLNQYDPGRLDMDAPVASSFIEFVDHHSTENELEAESCHVVDEGCEAPAGLLVGGTVMPAEHTGETHNCEGCGEPVCDNCSDENGICNCCNGRWE